MKPPEESDDEESFNDHTAYMLVIYSLYGKIIQKRKKIKHHHIQELKDIESEIIGEDPKRTVPSTLENNCLLKIVHNLNECSCKYKQADERREEQTLSIGTVPAKTILHQRKWYKYVKDHLPKILLHKVEFKKLQEYEWRGSLFFWESRFQCSPTF